MMRDSIDELTGQNLYLTFEKWIAEVQTLGASYLAVDNNTGLVNIGGRMPWLS